MRALVIIFVLTFIVTVLPTTSLADKSLQIGADEVTKHYMQSEILRRISLLEQTILDLQAQMSSLREEAMPEGMETWACTVDAYTTNYTGRGVSRGIARANAIEACNAENSMVLCQEVTCDN